MTTIIGQIQSVFARALTRDMRIVALYLDLESWRALKLHAAASDFSLDCCRYQGIPVYIVSSPAKEISEHIYVSTEPV